MDRCYHRAYFEHVESVIRADVARGRRSPNARSRIILADRNPILRAGMRAILERAPGMAIVGEATTYDAALLAVEEHGPDVLVLDLDLGDDTTRGLTLCEEISEQFPNTRILIVTSALSEIILFDALRRGATGYLVLDQITADELTRSVRAIQEGDTAFSKGIGALVTKRLGAIDTPKNELSERELEIVRLVASGLSNKQIAHELYIATSTVKFHLHNASVKLHAARRAELVHRAMTLGII